jgi:hypothetical protein
MKSYISQPQRVTKRQEGWFSVYCSVVYCTTVLWISFGLKAGGSVVHVHVHVLAEGGIRVWLWWV